MKKLAFLLVLIGLYVWPVGLRAQSAALMEAYQQGHALYDAGQYEQAIPFWRKVLELGENEFGSNHLTTANLLNNLATLYKAQGRYVEAEPLHKRALAIQENTLGAEHLGVAASVNNLAQLYEALG